MGPRRFVMLGAPGVGKGTQAKRIVARLQLCHLATGDMLRAAIRSGSDLGRQAAMYIDIGHLVPDSLVIEMVRERMTKLGCPKGFVLDGFPRTVAQAQELEKANIPIEAAIQLAVPLDELLRRLTGRQSCPECGHVYHVKFARSKDGTSCDQCGTALIRRHDDTEETILSRMKVYDEKTAPLAEYFRNRGVLIEIDGLGTPDEVFARIQAAIGIPVEQVG